MKLKGHNGAECCTVVRKTHLHTPACLLLLVGERVWRMTVMESSVHLFARYVNCRGSRVSGSVVMSVLVNCSTLQHSIHSGSGLADFTGQRQCRILSDMVGWRDKPFCTHGYGTTDALRFARTGGVNSLASSSHICPDITSGQGKGLSHPDVTLSPLTLFIESQESIPGLTCSPPNTLS